MFPSPFQGLAIIETNDARGLYKDNPKEAWVILTSLKVWIGLRMTALSLTLGNMDLDIHVAGPYGFYDPMSDHLLPEAFAVMTMLANYISPEMVDKPLQVLCPRLDSMRKVYPTLPVLPIEELSS